MSVADSMALGLANVMNATLVTCDHHEFECIDETNDAEFYWFR